MEVSYNKKSSYSFFQISSKKGMPYVMELSAQIPVSASKLRGNAITGPSLRINKRCTNHVQGVQNILGVKTEMVWVYNRAMSTHNLWE